jgi:hypothetical protein
MRLEIGTKIRYTSAAGTREATICNIKIGPTAKPDFLQTWMTLDIPVQEGVKFNTKVQIPASDGCLKMFQVQVV